MFLLLLCCFYIKDAQQQHPVEDVYKKWLILLNVFLSEHFNVDCGLFATMTELLFVMFLFVCFAISQ